MTDKLQLKSFLQYLRQFKVFRTNRKDSPIEINFTSCPSFQTLKVRERNCKMKSNNSGKNVYKNIFFNKFYRVTRFRATSFFINDVFNMWARKNNDNHLDINIIAVRTMTGISGSVTKERKFCWFLDFSRY